jgi:hypothetical protein
MEKLLVVVHTVGAPEYRAQRKAGVEIHFVLVLALMLMRTLHKLG